VISISVTARLDLPLNALPCAFNFLVAVSSFAHANVSFDSPRRHGDVFTTVETRSLHHQVRFQETRRNYANVPILLDRVFGTFRRGEAAVFGRDERKRLRISEQLQFPLRLVRAWIKGRSAPAPDWTAPATPEWLRGADRTPGRRWS